jgi:hypothetical protein
MSSLIYRQWKQYFQMPIDKRVENLSPSAYRLYGLLCREMNCRSAVELRYTNAEIARITQIKDHKTIRKARRELEGAGLIRVVKVPPGVCAYIMLNESGGAIPAPKDRRGIRDHSSHHATHAQSRTAHVKSTKDLPISRATEQNCGTHGNCEHWLRDGDWLCEKCHPNPNKPIPLTAKDLGFT